MTTHRISGSSTIKHIVRRELHTFGDASEEANCAVTYFRNVSADGHVTLLHIKATTKLLPTKTISVQKLELCAALLGARLVRFVGSALSRQIDGRFFWTDSSTIRHWVRSTTSGSDLPECRLDANAPPFSQTACNYFGPIYNDEVGSTLHLFDDPSSLHRHGTFSLC